ncbi:hypothetical protein [Streptomyces enissocaesilis]|uniref:Uncharacterized protein n=1 Tax=Streptomyces enissocaesilis TaxID=332589 RepID=A0ABN3XP73_9ACTN
MNGRELKGNVRPEVARASYATDGTDFRGALKHHYVFALKRFAKYFAIFVPMIVLLFVTGIGYLVPLAVVGFIGLLITVIPFVSAVTWTWRCSRVFRTYPLSFRGPVKKLDSRSGGKLILCLGEEGIVGSLVLSAMDPLSRSGWPRGIADGVWFAGDDLFGGAAIVPGTGELLFMQPRAWKKLSESRKHADADRIERAR